MLPIHPKADYIDSATDNVITSKSPFWKLFYYLQPAAQIGVSILILSR